MRTIDMEALENLKKNIEVLSEQYSIIVSSMPGQYALFKLPSDRLTELLTTNDEYNAARKNSYEYRDLSKRLERYIEESGDLYSIDNAEELQKIIDSFNGIARKDLFYFDGNVSAINSKIEEMRLDILNMEPFEEIEKRINSSDEIDAVFKKLALTKQKAVETKIRADYEIVKAYGSIAGLEVPLDSLVKKFDVDDFYFYDSKTEDKTGNDTDNKKGNNNIITFDHSENAADNEKEYEIETVESIDGFEPESESADEIYVEPEVKPADLSGFDFAIPSLNDVAVSDLIEPVFESEENRQEYNPEKSDENNNVDFGLESFIDLQKPIDDVEIMNSWWSKLQKALDDAGCEINMKCPEDLCRIIICEITKFGKSDYEIIPHYATDASRRPIDLNSISDEEIIERQNTGSLDYLCMKHIYRASQEGRLFVRDHPRTKGHMAPRQILISNHNEPYVGNDIFHMTDEEKLIGSLLDEPAAMERPGIGTKFKAIFGDDKASKEIRKFNSPEDDFAELLENWNRIKEIEAGDPAFVKTARNNMIVSLYYFGNPEIGASQKKYVMNLYELHKKTLNNK